MHLFFALTLFVSATLLFVVEPMFAKMVLPRLGGSPAVWNTCLVFYQAVLLAGYVYAHLTFRWLGARRQAILHLAILALPWLTLPIAIRTPWLPSWGGPSMELLVLLAASVGLPFFVVSSSTPMLQVWFADTRHVDARDPYFLYAASNLGSLASLLAYPLVIEPWLPLIPQSHAWTIGYGFLTALVAGCAVLLWCSPHAVTPDPTDEPASAGDEPVTRPTAGQRFRWLALSFIPSSLLLGVTTHISTDIAAVPLLWVVPLALYLLTFVLVFARRQWLPHSMMLRVQVYLMVLLALAFFPDPGYWTWAVILLHMVTFFVTAMVCHGELARSRPQARYLTEFYLWMSFGGMLGGMFNALVAPLVFPLLVEYPLVIAVACMFRPCDDSAPPHWLEVIGMTLFLVAVESGILLLAGVDMTARGITVLLLISLTALGAVLLRRQPRLFGTAIALLLVAGVLSSHRYGDLLSVRRSFFGVYQVKVDGSRKVHILIHGSTNHGEQGFEPERRRQPMSYYSRSGPVGQIFKALSDAKHWRTIGVIGLGTGTMASYGRDGQEIAFFEIDPTVVGISRDSQYFSFLRDTPAKVRIVLGDARLTMADEPDGRFDALFLDAFSSDAIPVHLLTREALALYCRKLTADGVLALHISNRYLNLAPLVGRLAADAGLACRICHDSGAGSKDENRYKSASVWVLVSRRTEGLGKLATDSHWESIPPSPHTSLWTDDYSNILTVLSR
jgi:hypothetical protein